jgi:hypothetical protein
MAAISFCMSECEFDLSKKEVILPRLFLWYKIDFICENINDLKEIESLSSKKQDELLLKYLLTQLRQDDDKYNKCKEILHETNIGRTKINYASYNWTINSRN